MCYIITIDMMLFSQLNSFQAKNTELKKVETMNALALVVFVLLFLISTVAHADHITAQANNAEQQECFICHQGLDSPSELPKVKTIVASSYSLKTYQTFSPLFNTSSFLQPQLRAPPVFL